MTTFRISQIQFEYKLSYGDAYDKVQKWIAEDKVEATSDYNIFRFIKSELKLPFSIIIRILNESPEKEKARYAECYAYAFLKIDGIPFTHENLANKLIEFYEAGAKFLMKCNSQFDVIIGEIIWESKKENIL